MKNQGNKTPPKEHNKLVTDPKEMKIHKLPDKEFRTIQKKLRELWENTDKKFNKIRKTTQELNEEFNKEIVNKKEPNRKCGTEEYNDWTKKKEWKASTIELIRQKTDSMNSRTYHLKLSNQKRKKQKEWKGMKKASET